MTFWQFAAENACLTLALAGIAAWTVVSIVSLWGAVVAEKDPGDE